MPHAPRIPSRERLTFATPTKNAATNQIKELPAGVWLNHVAFVVAGATGKTRGQFFAQVIVRSRAGGGAAVVADIPFQGYLTNAISCAPQMYLPPGLAWEAFVRIYTGSVGDSATIFVEFLLSDRATGDRSVVNEAPGTGQGYVRSIDLGDPAGGAEYADVTVPAGVKWRLRSSYMPFASDATVASRQPGIDVTDGTVKVARYVSRYAQTASRTINYVLHPGGSFVEATSSSSLITGMSQELVGPELDLPDGWVLDFTTVNIQATDNYGDGQLVIEEWAVPA